MYYLVTTSESEVATSYSEVESKYLNSIFVYSVVTTSYSDIRDPRFCAKIVQNSEQKTTVDTKIDFGYLQKAGITCSSRFF